MQEGKAEIIERIDQPGRKIALNWKWSIYVKKTLFDHVAITAQAAGDLSTLPGGFP